MDGDTPIRELEAADAVVLAMPIYNFSPPATLKAWADLVTRSGVTFHPTQTGPKGALRDQPVCAVVTSGGLPIDAAADHATPWLRQFLVAIWIADVRVIKAARLVAGGPAAAQAALELVLPAAPARAASKLRGSEVREHTR